MTNPDSIYAKPFLTVPEQIQRLRERGMDCGDDAYAARVLERYGYYRLSGYWHLYRERPTAPAPLSDEVGRDIRLNSFVDGTSLAHVVSLYEFDHDLRTRLGDVLSMIETAFRFFIGHRLGRIDAFAHRHPRILGAVRAGEPGEPARATTAYREWLEEYDRHERRARGDFVVHFRKKYGPHLPIWVATEVMSFGVLSNLYLLMPQGEQEILAARLQLHSADGHGDRGALGNWLNSLRHVRNICAHYGRLWNRTFDVLIDAPGQARKDAEDFLAPLVDHGTNNRLYGVLLIMRHLLLSIAPGRTDVVDIAEFVESRSQAIGFDMERLGFPEDWKDSPLWRWDFTLDRSPMVAGSLLDRVVSRTAAETRKTLTEAPVTEPDRPRTPAQTARAKNAAQRSLLRTYLKHRVVIEIELGQTKYYPAFQFRGGEIIDALAEINKCLASSCGDSDRACVAEALLEWWQKPHPDLPMDSDGSVRSPLDLLSAVPEGEFIAAVSAVGAMSSFRPPSAHP